MSTRWNIISEINNSGDARGDGFRRDILHNLYEFYLLSSGLQLTATLTTNPGYAKAETNATVLQWAATKVVAAGLTFTIPGDYDNQKDELILRLFARSGGATDAPIFTVIPYRSRQGVALATLATKTSAAIPLSTSTVATPVTIDLSGLGCQSGDSLTLSFVPGTHGTDAVNLYGIKSRYRSVLALASIVDR